MRELKFRAWSNDLEKFLPHIEFDNDWQNGWSADDPDADEFEQSDGDGLIIEQFTGLIDRKGKEVYDGDVVKANWRRAKHARFNTSGEVVFYNGMFAIKDDPDGQDRLGIMLYACYDIEVIGNVHELKDKEKRNDTN